MNNQRESSTLLKLFSLVLVIALFIMGLASYVVFESIITTSTLARVQAIAEQKRYVLEDYIEDSRQQISQLHRNTAWTDYAERYFNDVEGHTQEQLKQVDKGGAIAVTAGAIVQHRGFYDFFLIAPQGDIVYTFKQEADLGTNLEHGPYRNSGLAEVFREVLKGQSIAHSRFSYYQPSREPASFIAAPLHNQQGEFIGVLALQLALDRITLAASNYTNLGASGEIVLAAAGENAEPVPITPLRHAPDAAFDVDFFDDLSGLLPISRAIRGEAGVGKSVDYRGVKIVVAWLPLEYLDWGMVVKIDYDEIMKPVQDLQLIMLGLAVVTFFLMYLMTRFVTSIRT